MRGGTGLFSGKPPYVWISNQIGNTGVLYGFADTRNTTAFPFNPNPDKYKPAPTGGAAASYELDVTDQSFRFPQTWRTNIGVDRKLPWGLVGTLDYIYNRDLNAPVYVNANLPAAEGAYTGVDNRPRWAATAPGAAPAPGITVALPACAATGQVGACFTRLNNAPGNQITNAYVIKNQSQNRSWNISGALTKNDDPRLLVQGRLQLRRVEEPRRALVHGRHVVGLGESDRDRSEQPGAGVLGQLARQARLPGGELHRSSTSGSAATTFSVFYDGHTNGNTSYVFAGDANGDTVIGNDLIYIPRDTSEMNFKPLTVSGRTYTAADQAAAFEQFIQADSYLSSHRGQYAERNAVFLPIVNRIDLSVMPGPVPQRRRPQALRPDSSRHHQLRQPAEQQLGRRPASGQHPDPDEPRPPTPPAGSPTTCRRSAAT